MEIVSPSGRVYKWDKPTPPTEEDIAALQAFDAQQQPAAAKPAQPQAPRQQLGAFAAGMAGNPMGMPQMIRSPEGGPAAAKVMGMVADAGLEGAGAAGGQVVGAMTGPAAPIMVPALGAVGGAAGNALAQGRRMWTGEQEGFRFGEMGGAALTGAVPGASLAGAPLKTVGKEVVKQGVANVAGMATETGIDQGRLPSVAEMGLATVGAVAGTTAARKIDTGTNPTALATVKRESQDATRRATLKAGQELGYVLPPTVVSQKQLDRALNSVGGKAATAQQVIHQNQPITNSVVRKELGVSDEVALSPTVIDMLKKKHGKVYEEVASLNPRAKVLLDEFKQAQADSNAGFAQYRSMFPKDPAVLQAAKARQADADKFFEGIGLEAHKMGDPYLWDRLGKARVELAKVGLAERALNKGDGNIDAQVIGDAYEFGEKLTGGFEKIGRFQNAFGKYVKAAADTPPAGVHQLPAYAAAGLGAAGAHQLGPAGALIGLAPIVAPGQARNVMMSKWYQQGLRPSYGDSPQDFTAALARMSAQSASRDPMLPGPDGIPEYLRAR